MSDNNEQKVKKQKAIDLLYKHSNVKGGSKGHYEDETQIVYSMMLYAQSENAALKLEVEKLRDKAKVIGMDAYRKGLRDAFNQSDIKPFLITSQVVGHQIAEQALKEK